MGFAPDVPLRIRQQVRFDCKLGVASVKDVIFLITLKSESAATQLLQRLVKKHSWVADKIRCVAIEGKGKPTPVAEFPTLLDVIFLVSVYSPRGSVSATCSSDRFEHAGARLCERRKDSLAQAV